MTTALDRYADKLLSINEQLERLRRYNSHYWYGYLAEEQLNAVIAPGDHELRIDDLKALHVQFSSLEETIEMWWRVYVGEQPHSWRWPELLVDAEHLRLLDSSVATYEPGIHPVRINLIAHWKPESGRTLEEVRAQAKQSGETLAQLETMSTYGLHSELLREQDGENLPYPDIAGTDVSVPGSSWPRTLYVCWDPFDHRAMLSDRRAMLSARRVDFRGIEWASPVILG
jgi:hypothetical protein